MNILSAIYSGQTGFLKATKSLAERASRIASPGATDDQLVEDTVLMNVDKAFAEANTRTIAVSGSLMNEFIRDSMKK